MDTFPLSRPLTLDEFVKGYADGGAVGVSAPVDLDFALPGGSDKPLMQQLYEDGLVTEREYLDWLAESSGQPAADQSASEKLYFTDQPEPNYNLFVEGADVPESTGIDYDAMSRAFGMLGDTGKLEPIAYGRGFSLGNLEGGLPITENRNVRATPAAQLSLEQLGLTREEADKIAAQYDANKAAVSPLAQLSMADVAQQAGVSEADLAASQEQIGEVYGARQNTLQKISDRLKKNDFKGAFDVAVAAEDAGEGQFFENIVNPELMRYMRGPMTKDEIKKFYEAIPQDEYIKRYGEGNMFILDKGIEESLAALGDDEVGFVDPRAALIARPDPTIGIIGDLVAAGLAATGIGIPAAMAISGAQKYVTSGGNLKAALTSAALTGVGMKVGEAVKAGLSPGIDQLTGVTTTASRAATAAADAAANAVSSGVAPSALAEIVVTAARQAAPNLAQSVIGSVTGSVLNQLAAQGVDIPEQQLEQARQATQRGPLEQAQATANVPPDLEEIVVQSLRKGAPIDVNTLLANTGAQGVQDILSERQIQEQQELEQREAQQEQQPEQQQEPDDFAGTFRIATDALPKLDIYAGAWPALSQQLASAGYKKPLIDEQITPDDIEELVIRASKPTELDLFAGVPNFISNVPDVLNTRAPAEYYPELEQVTVEAQRPAEVDLSLNVPDLSSQIDFYDKPAFADTPLDEVVVKTNRPTELDLVAPPFDIPKTTTPPEVDVPEGPIEEVVVEGKRPEDVDFVAPPITLPLKTPVDVTEPKINEPSKFKQLLDKYGTLENALKLLGAVSGLGGTGGAGAGTGAGGEGYDPRKSAGAGAWIDWEKVKAEADAAGMNLNTYTARNWNKIQNRALEAGAPQAVAPTTPQGYNSMDFNSPNFDLLKYLEEYQPAPMSRGGMSMGNRVKGPGDGREDLIPALLSDGEYVIDAETMALLGNGSTDAGAKAMDSFRQEIRRHKGAQLAKGGISPNAKSPLQYLKGK
jgi:hypothetical protein